MRQVALFIVVLLIASLWRPLLRPIGAGAVIVADIYSGALWDRNLAAAVTPQPRVEEATLRIRDADMRVTWWIPGWGARHPGVMLVNGATEFGNDDSETRRLSDALARAGYLVMLPEFPFIKAGTLEREATAIIDAAFAVLRDHPETRGMPTGAFGFSSPRRRDPVRWNTPHTSARSARTSIWTRIWRACSARRSAGTARWSPGTPIRWFASDCRSRRRRRSPIQPTASG